jgi:TetR/AcrR family transcriptional repressor of nem operon
MAKKSDKRERLINAAKELFYKQGFNNTTIADIAKSAEVPLGNVYYYFKTKDEICDAVIKERSLETSKMIAEFNTLNSAEEKLVAIVNFYSENAQEIAQYGNIFSELAQELSRQNSPLAAKAKEVLVAIIEWLHTQFKAYYSDVDAKNYAIQFLSTLQGIQVLTLALQDPSLIMKQVELLKAEIKQLTTKAAA